MNKDVNPSPETGIRIIEIAKAVPEDAEIICDIRDRAWLDAYPNPELGISAEDILLNAKGEGGVFVPKRVAYLRE